MTSAGRLLAAGILALLLVGCGKSAHEQLVDDANRICRDGDRQIKALPKVTNQRALASAAERQATIIARARAKLGRLEPPEPDRPAYAQYLGALDVTVRSTRVISLAARAGRLADIRALGAQAREDTLKVRRLARSLGLRDCARGSR